LDEVALDPADADRRGSGEHRPEEVFNVLRGQPDEVAVEEENELRARGAQPGGDRSALPRFSNNSMTRAPCCRAAHPVASREPSLTTITSSTNGHRLTAPTTSPIVRSSLNAGMIAATRSIFPPRPPSNSAMRGEFLLMSRTGTPRPMRGAPQ